MTRREPQGVRVAHQVQALHNVSQRSAPAALAEHRVGMLFVHHDPEEDAGADQQQHGEHLHQDAEIARDAAHKARRDEERHQHPDAVDNALHPGGGESKRQAQVVPVGQQVAADHFPGAQRKHFVREKSDVDRLHRAPETQARHRRQQRVPTPAVGDVHGEIGHHGQTHPTVIQRAQRRPEFVERVTVKHPDEARRGDAVTEHLRKPAWDFTSRCGHAYIIA